MNWFRVLSSTVLIVCVLLVSVSAGQYSGGTGEPDNPYQIANINDLLALAANTSHYDRHFILTADINLNGYSYTKALIAPNPDNNVDHHGTAFAGTFNGDGHVISNLTINTAGVGNSYLGLFGKTDSFAHILNLGLENINITGGDDSRHIGGLVGLNWEGCVISNCYARGNIGSGDNSRYLGGLAGDNYKGSINNCYASVVVNGGDSSENIGGLIGYSEHGNINNCYATGAVTSGNNSWDLGGLVGDYYYGNISNCYFLYGSGPNNGAGTALSDAQMQQQSSFVAWDFINESLNGTSQIWQMPSGGGYPLLSRFHGYVPPNLSGQGTAGNPYLITNPNELGAVFHYDAGAYYRLEANIDLSEINWSTVPIPYFSGVFDGNGHTITSLSIASGWYLGIFGYVDGGEINNLALESVNINGGDFSRYLGGLMGYNNQGEISNCYATGAVTAGRNSYYLGGLVGHNGQGNISNCYTIGAVTGGNSTVYLGGLVGYNDQGNISDSYATGTVTGTSYLGGLVGYNSQGGISNCYSTANIEGGYRSLGGLVGQNILGDISDCYATGAVTGDYVSFAVGGLVGRSEQGHINNCYATGVVTGDGRAEAFGGLLGYNYQGNISDCYAIGSVIGGYNPYYLGGLVGHNLLGDISNCHATGMVTGGDNSDNLGGLVGQHLQGDISNCYATGAVTGGDRPDSFGGLVGYNRDRIINCYATGNVTGGDDIGLLGGLVGRNNQGDISDCYATGTVTGGNSTVYLGGLVGSNWKANINNCYATGFIEGGVDSEVIGGLVGYNNNGSVNNCFWDRQTTSLNDGVGNNDGTIYNLYGKTTAQMQTQSTFTDYGWDFVGEAVNGLEDIWRICEDREDYPQLWWEEYAPVADAGEDQVVFGWYDGTVQIALNGSGSYDIDCDELSYNWFLAGQEIATGVNPTVDLIVTEPNVVIELIVNDGTEDSAPDEVVIIVIPALEIGMKFTPQAMNLESKGKWIKAHMVLPTGYSVEAVDANTPATLLPLGIVSEYINVFVNGDGLVEMEIVFDRSQICGAEEFGQGEVTVVGMLKSGQYFYGMDEIKIVHDKLGALMVIVTHWLETDCRKPKWCAGADVNQDTRVNLLDYALTDGCSVDVINN